MPPDRLSAAQLLTQHKEEILSAWEAEARRDIPAATDRKRYVLIDSLPKLIDEVIDALENRRHLSRSLVQTAKTHTIQRIEVGGFTLQQVQAEYTILRSILIKTLDSGLAPGFSEERNIILDIIEVGRAAAADQYLEVARAREDEARRLTHTANERLSLALNAAKMGIFDWNVETQQLNWSDTLKTLYGYGRESKGAIDEFWNRVHPDDRTRVQQAIQESLEKDHDYNMEYRIVWPDQSVHWIHAKGKAYPGPDGKLRRFTGVALDISERKESEQRLRAAHKALEEEHAWSDAILNKIPTPIVLVSIDRGEIILSNEATRQINIQIPRNISDLDSEQYYATDALGKRIPSMDLPRFRILHGEEVRDFEMNWHTPGATVPLLMNGTLLPASHGKPPIGLMTFHDVSKLKKAEEELRESEHRLRILTENIPQFIWTADPSGSSGRYNQNWYDYTGLTPENGQDLHWHQVVHPDDLERNLKAWNKVQSTGETYTIEHRLRRHDGVYRWFLTRAIPYRDKTGKISTWFGTSTDIENLKQAQQDLEKERELREQFVNTLTHDLRNPLSAAKTSAQIISRYPDRTERIPGLAARIVDSIERADRMIQDLLDTSRIRAGRRIPLEIVHCDLVTLASRTCEDLSTVYGDRFDRQFPAKLEGYWSCRELERLLENLLTNAIKYGYSHTPIAVQLKDLQDKVTIAVHNEGQPIPPEELQHLFDPFIRSRVVESGQKRGWGLGLTLVRGVAEAHGGSVNVESEEERGTTFTVTLPKDARKAAKPTPPLRWVS